MGKSAPKPPQPVDPNVVAGAQYNANANTALLQADINRYNTVTPFGSSTWTRPTSGALSSQPGTYQGAGTTNKWSNYLTDNPDLQSYYSAHKGTKGFNFASPEAFAEWHYNNLGKNETSRVAPRESQGATGAASGASGGDTGSTQWTQTTQLAPELQGAFNSFAGGIQAQPTGVNPNNEVSDAMYQQAVSRLNPQWQQQDEQTRTQLANQGLTPGGEGYDKAYQNFLRAKNDAYNQANWSSIQAGETAGLNRAQFGLQRNLSSVQGLQGLYSLINPGAIAPIGVSPTDATGAYGLSAQQANNAYNAQMAGYQSNMQGLYNLGSAAAIAMSDRRVKHAVRKLWTRHDGLNVYAFKYLWSKVVHIGVMAQEVLQVKPEAVVDLNGILAVDYGMLD